MQLFRSEVLAARQTQWLGTIAIGRPISFTVLALIAIALASALICFVEFASIARKAKISGFLSPVLGNMVLTSSLNGVIAEIKTKEGERVHAGDTLIVLDTDQSSANGSTGAEVGKSLDQRRESSESDRVLRRLQARQREQALADRIASAELELRQSELGINLAKGRIQLSAKTVERYRQLAKEGFVSEILLQQKEEDLLELQDRLQIAERASLAISRNLITFRADLASSQSQLKTELNEIDRNLATLREAYAENATRQRLFIRSTQDGVVAAGALSVGQVIKSGQTLLTLIPLTPEGRESPLIAQLYAPSRAIGFIQRGQTVWVRYAAFPYAKFGMAKAVVTSVSLSPVNPQDFPAGQSQALISASQANEPMFRIDATLEKQTIEAYGNAVALKPGLALDADVIQDHRAIWEWLLEPLLATAARTTQ